MSIFSIIVLVVIIAVVVFLILLLDRFSRKKGGFLEGEAVKPPPPVDDLAPVRRGANILVILVFGILGIVAVFRASLWIRSNNERFPWLLPILIGTWLIYFYGFPILRKMRVFRTLLKEPNQAREDE